MSSTRTVQFRGSAGSQLTGSLDLPGGRPHAYAVFAHCFTCSKDSHAASRIGKALAERSVAVLRFDFTGLGASGGNFGETTFSSNVDDLVAAAGFLRDHYQAPKLLIGHSLGGAAVLAAAARIPESTAVVTIGAPFEPAHISRLLPTDIGSDGADVTIAGRTIHVGAQFLRDVSRQHLDRSIRHLRRALLVLHGTRDTVVGVDNARQIFEAARHPKSFVSLDEADHLLADRADATFAASIIAAWSGKYLSMRNTLIDDTNVIERGTVQVAETGDGGYAQVVRAGPHVIRADEPPDVGTDTGPSPYDLLLAALGACTSMTLRMYADRKKWPLDHISVRLTHNRIHADDCRDCTSSISTIQRQITLEGDLDDTQRAKLLTIAERCPVHRTLTEDARVETRLADRASPSAG